MQLAKFSVILIGLLAFLTTPALAADIQSISLISLANSSRPWTITVQADGQVEWNDSSSGYLLDSVFGESDKIKRKTRTMAPAEVKAVFGLISRTGYARRLDMAREPKIVLIVTLTDGTEIINNGPGDMAGDADKKTFRDIEARMVTAAGFNYKKELIRSDKQMVETELFLFYGYRYKDL